MAGVAVAIGECLVDLITPGGSNLTTATQLQIRDGGAPANVAVALARLGVPSRLHAVVGDDPFGERLRLRLAREGVDVSRVRVAEGEPTTFAFAWADDRGDGQFRLHRHADTLLSPDDVDETALAGASAIIVGSVATYVEPSRSAVLSALRVATDAGIPVVVDPNIRPGAGVSMDDMQMTLAAMLSAATLVKLSVDDAREMWGASSIRDAARALERFSPDIAVITDGARSAALWTDGDLLELPAFRVDAVEPTGAGDAFTAAFVSRMLEREWRGATSDDLRYAMAAGALATTRPGAMDGLPGHAEIERFLRDLG